MRFFCFFVVLLILVKRFASEVKQEGATVTICNYKYVTECYAKTRRIKRGEPYKTNLTAVSKYTFGNNITLRAGVYSGVPVEVLNLKLCELSKVQWLREYLGTYSSLNGDCPYKPGLYGFYNMVFPPKNLPQTIVNLFKGKIHAKFIYVITKTEEIVIEYSLMLNVV